MAMAVDARRRTAVARFACDARHVSMPLGQQTDRSCLIAPDIRGSLDTLEVGRVLVTLGYSKEMKFEELLAEVRHNAWLFAEFVLHLPKVEANTLCTGRYSANESAFQAGLLSCSTAILLWFFQELCRWVV